LTPESESHCKTFYFNPLNTQKIKDSVNDSEVECDDPTSKKISKLDHHKPIPVGGSFVYEGHKKLSAILRGTKAHDRSDIQESHLSMTKRFIERWDWFIESV